MNPLYLLVIVIALVVAYVDMRRASARRIVAVLAGCFAGYGVSIAVNALFSDIMLWLTSSGILHSNLDSPIGLDTGDIETGLVVAGAGMGLLVSMFIRDTARTAGHDEAKPEFIAKARRR